MGLGVRQIQRCRFPCFPFVSRASSGCRARCEPNSVLLVKNPPLAILAGCRNREFMNCAQVPNDPVTSVDVSGLKRKFRIELFGNLLRSFDRQATPGREIDLHSTRSNLGMRARLPRPLPRLDCGFSLLRFSLPLTASFDLRKNRLPHDVSVLAIGSAIGKSLNQCQSFGRILAPCQRTVIGPIVTAQWQELACDVNPAAGRPLKNVTNTGHSSLVPNTHVSSS